MAKSPRRDSLNSILPLTLSLNDIVLSEFESTDTLITTPVSKLSCLWLQTCRGGSLASI